MKNVPWVFQHQMLPKQNINLERVMCSSTELLQYKHILKTTDERIISSKTETDTKQCANLEQAMKKRIETLQYKDILDSLKISLGEGVDNCCDSISGDDCQVASAGRKSPCVAIRFRAQHHDTSRPIYRQGYQDKVPV